MRAVQFFALVALACGGKSTRAELELEPTDPRVACLAWCDRFCDECERAELDAGVCFVGPKAPCDSVCAWNETGPPCELEAAAFWNCQARHACGDARELCAAEAERLELCRGGS